MTLSQYFIDIELNSIGKSSALMYDTSPELQKWPITGQNQGAYENMADVDALLALQVPGPDASDEVFYAFERNLQSIKMGRRYSNSDFTSPLLGWYVYIAKYSPETIYRLYNEGNLGNRKVTHLIDFGFLDDWFQYIKNSNGLILGQRSSLLSIALLHGDEYAKRIYIEAFFDGTDKNPNRHVKNSNLLYAVDHMTVEERSNAKKMFLSGQRKIDPREVLSLYQSELFPLTSKEALAIIDINKYNENGTRMMSSYFSDAAGLGNEYYFKLLMADLADNDNQPNNFYCAACGVALYGEGLIGEPLITSILLGNGIPRVTKRNNTYVMGDFKE